jgi:hypothetical protein
VGFAQSSLAVTTTSATTMYGQKLQSHVKTGRGGLCSESFLGERMRRRFRKRLYPQRLDESGDESRPATLEAPLLESGR